MKKNATSCGCEADMKKEVKQMINDVEGYSKTDHELKGREVRAAFKPAGKKEEKAAKK